MGSNPSQRGLTKSCYLVLHRSGFHGTKGQGHLQPKGYRSGYWYAQWTEQLDRVHKRLRPTFPQIFTESTIN